MWLLASEFTELPKFDFWEFAVFSRLVIKHGNGKAPVIDDLPIQTSFFGGFPIDLRIFRQL
jgi:hypothetical protein